MQFFPLEKLININNGYTRQFKIDNLSLLLFQRADELYLIEASCPHREHPLDEASISDGVIQCALHQYQFSIEDGKLLKFTEERCRGLITYELSYRGNEVGVMLDDRRFQ